MLRGIANAWNVICFGNFPRIFKIPNFTAIKVWRVWPGVHTVQHNRFETYLASEMFSAFLFMCIRCRSNWNVNSRFTARIHAIRYPPNSKPIWLDSSNLFDCVRMCVLRASEHFPFSSITSTAWSSPFWWSSNAHSMWKPFIVCKLVKNRFQC